MYGKLQELLKFNVSKFQTTIPDMFSLPELKNNIAEGIVIKPVVTKYLNNNQRVILKIKNNKFGEVKKYILPKTIDNIAVKYTTILSNYITENRLRNVMSKMISITPKNFNRLIGLLAKDALEEFLEDLGDEFLVLKINTQKKIKSSLGRMCRSLLDSHKKSILEGYFFN